MPRRTPIMFTSHTVTSTRLMSRCTLSFVQGTLVEQKEICSYMKLLTTRYVDYLEQLHHDFWKEVHWAPQTKLHWETANISTADISKMLQLTPILSKWKHSTTGKGLNCPLKLRQVCVSTHNYSVQDLDSTIFHDGTCQIPHWDH